MCVWMLSIEVRLQLYASAESGAYRLYNPPKNTIVIAYRVFPIVLSNSRPILLNCLREVWPDGLRGRAHEWGGDSGV